MKEFKAQAEKSMRSKIRAHGGVPGRATGGKTGHSDIAADTRLVHSLVKPEALKRAAGGHVKAPKKPHTQVNIAIAPKGDGPAPAPIGAGAAAPVLPPRPAPRPVPAPIPAGNGPGGPGGPGLPIGAKRGGGIKRAAGGKVPMTAGAANGIGREEKIAAYGSKAGVRKSK